MSVSVSDVMRRVNNFFPAARTEGAWQLRQGMLLPSLHSPGVSFSGITDGTKCPDVSFECRCEPKADGKYPEVMAASILAKNCRDRIMIEMDKKYPEYGYAKHKGYPTRDHKEVCKKIGPSPIQRLSFRY